ncbi:MAG: carbamoylphosphate synthase large subunit [Clostridiales bacterium]|nr:carbamoylphosphate synthase large subunit [Clostridiales bacterium]
MNFVFISPNFPHTYWQFCDRLKRRGVNVLGIGDCPYDDLEDSLKEALTEYYKVDSLEDYDKVYRAVAFFSFKYGKIDWLESNNEYWLEKDARLREDFNITTGVQTAELALWKSKSAMKPVYREAGIPTARNHKVTDIDAARAFLDEIGGFPVIVKPDIGVGATDTWKLENEDDLKWFYDNKPESPYVMEEFVYGNIYSYDAICDSKGDVLFESSNWFPPSIADLVNNDLELAYYTTDTVPEQLRELGRKALKGFKVKSRFVHFEFFRLTSPRKNLGEVGDFVGLEVNMRPAGGYTPDMMDFAHNTDVYQIWAEMVTDDKRLLPDIGGDKFCVYASRRDSHQYAHSHEEILEKYGSRVVMCERMPDALSGAMGNQMYTALAESQEEVDEFIEYVHKRA